MGNVVPTVEAYLKNLPEDRRKTIDKLRRFILKHLPPGYEEGIQYGMIAYYVPLSAYPKTYNGQPLGYIAIASHKNYISLYLMSIYGSGEIEFRRAYRKTGKKLDMGKSCVRFKTIDDLPLDLIAETITRYTPEEFIALHESGRG